MSEATINAAVITLLKADAGVGAVHSFEKYVNDPALYFRKHFVRAGKVNGWICKTDRQQATVLSCAEDDQAFKTTIRGFLSADDATETEIAARATVHRLCNTLDANLTLSLADTWGEKAVPADLVTGMVQFGDASYRVHQITITQTHTQRVSVTYV